MVSVDMNVINELYTANLTVSSQLFSFLHYLILTLSSKHVLRGVIGAWRANSHTGHINILSYTCKYLKCQFMKKPHDPR